MNEAFVNNVLGHCNVLMDAGFRPLASTLGCANQIMRRDDGIIVLQTDYGEFEVAKTSVFDLRQFGILTLIIKGKCGECELDVCDVRIMAELGRIGEAEKVFGHTLHFKRGDSTPLSVHTDTEAFKICRERGYPGCIDRFEHFLRSAYWLDGQGVPIRKMYQFAELDARLISPIPNTYRNCVGGVATGYAYDMKHFGVSLHSRYEAIPRIQAFMSRLNQSPLFATT